MVIWYISNVVNADSSPNHSNNVGEIICQSYKGLIGNKKMCCRYSVGQTATNVTVLQGNELLSKPWKITYQICFIFQRWNWSNRHGLIINPNPTTNFPAWCLLPVKITNIPIYLRSRFFVIDIFPHRKYNPRDSRWNQISSYSYQLKLYWKVTDWDWRGKILVEITEEQ